MRSERSILQSLQSAFATFGKFLKRGFWEPRRRSLRLCETLSLGNRGFLAVVRYQEERFLVGGTNSSISLLAQLKASSRSDDESGDGSGATA